MINRLDIVMWTLNSEKTLPYALESIEKAIPSKIVNQKIVVDGQSEDRTREIAESFGWSVVVSDKKGVGYQANIALSLVKTEFFASFEHDIILDKNWFKIQKYFYDPLVAVAQGVRVATDKTMGSIEKYELKRNKLYTSIDNALYRTSLIRAINGFDSSYITACDRVLYDNVTEHGFEWIVDRSVISKHIKPSVKDYSKHLYRLGTLKGYAGDMKILPNFVRFLFSPLRGLHIAFVQHCLMASVVYPYWRFWELKTSVDAKRK